MLVTIDTTNKTVILKSAVKLSEMKELQALLGADYKGYTIISDVVSNYPIIQYPSGIGTFIVDPYAPPYTVTCAANDNLQFTTTNFKHN